MPKQPTGKASRTKPKKAAWPRMVDHLAQVILRNSFLEDFAAIDPAERDLACIDLENELKSGRRKAMRRNLNTGEWGILPSAFWEKRQIFLVNCSGVWVAWVYERQGPLLGSVVGPRDDEHVYFVAPDLERRGRGPKFTDKQITELQTEYRAYKKANPVFKKDDANAHLQKYAKDKFDKSAHADTIRDRIIAPVDEADALEK
jgi:hypothetical protein